MTGPAEARPTLADRLLRRIAREGPMRVSEYMAACLTDPQHGYYTGRDPLGAAGDFTTAPEISQLFGEMVALWMAQVWQDIGAPEAVTLAELGPGRGTLMADILRTAAAVPEFRAALAPWLVEASPTLASIQKQTISGAGARWTGRVEDLPSDRPLLIVANEFFDALPIRQFVRGKGCWHERMVGADAGALSFGFAPGSADPELDRRFPDTAEGVMVEICAPGEAIMTTLAPAIAAHSGAMLIIDYGAWSGTGDTLQAVAGHRYADPLADPGGADLTAHVGFRWLAEAAAPLQAAPLTAQGVFLERLGITARAQVLARGPHAGGIAAQHRRLVHPDEMGTLFQVLALRSAGAPMPPGVSA